jgi:hypothetical protein
MINVFSLPNKAAVDIASSNLSIICSSQPADLQECRRLEERIKTREARLERELKDESSILQ